MNYIIAADLTIICVMNNEDDAENYYDMYGGDSICCYDGYYNAVCIQTLWGM